VTSPAYPAARAIAGKVRSHFISHLELARRHGRTGLASEPALEAIEAVIDAAFWASLRREEGLTPRISLALLQPDEAERPLLFAHRLPLRPAALAKLAPAVERPGIHLGVGRDESSDLSVWGTTRTIPAFCLVVEVVTSGLLVIKHRSEAFGKFVNVAVLEGDQVKLVDEGFSRQPECPGPVRSLLGFDPRPDREGPVDVLVLLATSMRGHGRGGTLLVVPSSSSTWMESIVEPVLYQVTPPFTELAALVRREAEEAESHEWQDDLRRAVDAIAGLTAVDGATLITDRYELVAFGAKISRRRGSAPVERVIVTEPVEGAAVSILTPAQLGGTRHLSAAQFVHDQHGATALVASQDGRFTIFKWSPADDLVHAHRVEALLL
jgi:hypothetical protein